MKPTALSRVAAGTFYLLAFGFPVAGVLSGVPELQSFPGRIAMLIGALACVAVATLFLDPHRAEEIRAGMIQGFREFRDDWRRFLRGDDR